MNQQRQLGTIAYIVGLTLSFALAATTQAAIIAHDDFESYTDASTVIGGTGGSGWAQPWIGNTTTATPLALASSGKIAGYGKSLELGVTTAAENRGIAVRQFPTQTGDFYIGMVLQTTNGWDGDFWQPYLNNSYLTTDTVNASFSFGLLNDSPLNRYFARKGGPAGNITTASSTLQHTSVSNDIHTVIAKFSKSTGMASDLYDQVTLWVDQTTEGTPTAAVAAADVGTTALNASSLSVLHFRVSSLESTDRVYLDSLTVATSFAEALPIPEPSGIALLIVGLAFVGIRTTNQCTCQCRR
jgi:hypothetical protein